MSKKKIVLSIVFSVFAVANIVLYLIFALVYYLCSKLKTEHKFIIAAIILSVIGVLPYFVNYVIFPIYNYSI